MIDVVCKTAVVIIVLLIFVGGPCYCIWEDHQRYAADIERMSVIMQRGSTAKVLQIYGLRDGAVAVMDWNGVRMAVNPGHVPVIVGDICVLQINKYGSMYVERIIVKE